MKATELHRLRKVLGLTQAGLAKAVGVTPNAIALAERGERGISEPLARLVKMLLQVHTGELVPRRCSTRKGGHDEATWPWHGLSAWFKMVDSVPLEGATVSRNIWLDNADGCYQAPARRMAEMGTGQLRGPDFEKTTFADLVQIIRDDYTVNQRRSTRRLETSLKVLEPAFGRMRACDITLDRLNHYLSERMATGIAPATAKLELTHLHKAFRLAERAGKVICPPFPQITVQNVRTGFFERADFEAVRGHLPEAFKGPITFACLTGWRVPSEILTLRWKQVDFSAGMVRLEPGTTKNDEGRVFPFGVLPELANLLRSQWETNSFLEMATGQTIPIGVPLE